MAYEHRPDNATAFLNDKGGNEARPDFKGDGLLHGIPTWISIWKKKTKNGDTWLSIQITKKDELSKTSRDGGNFPKAGRVEMSDDIPF